MVVHYVVLWCFVCAFIQKRAQLLINDVGSIKENSIQDRSSTQTASLMTELTLVMLGKTILPGSETSLELKGKERLGLPDMRL